MNLVCKSCNTEKASNEFYNNSSKKNGKDAKCKECRKKRHESWIKENSLHHTKKKKEYYENNRDDILDKKKVYYEKNRENILNKKKSYSRRAEVRRNRREYNRSYRRDNSIELKKKRTIAKLRILNGIRKIFGDCCQNCGESDYRLLTIDHVNNDGNDERRKYRTSVAIKRAIVNGQLNHENYKLLCHNCNSGRFVKNPTSLFKNERLVGEEKLCPTCGLNKDLSFFHKRKERYGKDRYYECGICKSFRLWLIKINCIEFLGGSCVLCGASEPYLLNVDHIEDDGNLRRKEEGTGAAIYGKVLNGEITGVQLLCFNCNHAKSREYYSCDFEFDLDSLSFNFNCEPECDFLDNYHYAGSGRPGKCWFSACLDEEIIAVAKFSSPIRKETANSLGFPHDQVLELDRLCICPGFNKKNLVSYFLSKIVKYITNNLTDIKILVSFADPRFGHDGTAYKASNWECLGKTFPSYHYVDSCGNEIHKKTVYNRALRDSLKESVYVTTNGLVKIKDPPKLKFIYRL